MQKTGEEIIFFQYGAGGVPLGFVYNGTQYFYVTNQLGDVLGITDSTGNAFVMYSYDEWGNPIQTVTRDNTAEQNKLAQLNPLRYRGYYYDAETGYYYLQSRYCNPKWGRFISADSFSYIDAFTRLGFNAYIYCENNPIMFVDPSGTEEEFNPNITEQGKAVVQIIFSTIFIDGMLDIIKNLSSGAYELISKLAKSFPEIVASGFILFTGIMSNLWDEFQDALVTLFENAVSNTVDQLTKMFDALMELSKKIGEKAIKVNPLFKVGNFIVNGVETEQNNLFTPMQKTSLIFVDLISLVIDLIFPQMSFSTGIIKDAFVYVFQLIMKSGFLINNGNILH